MSDNISSRTKLEQGRAEFAFDEVRNAIDLLGKDSSKEYKAYVKKMPMYIMVNGLGAAMSFALYKGQKNKAWRNLYEHIEGWLSKSFKHIISFEEKRLVGELVKVESAIYRATTAEVLALLTWLRRFADGLIEGEAINND